MNLIASEPTKRFEQKSTKVLTIVDRRTDYVFRVMGSRVKVGETFASGG